VIRSPIQAPNANAYAERWIRTRRDEWLIPRHTERLRNLYRGRGAVERSFGRLKHDYGLKPLRVRGLARVQLHADLTMIARLAQALSRARAVPLAA
jgi:transposase